jgi:peroxiredoxin
MKLKDFKFRALAAVVLVVLVALAGQWKLRSQAAMAEATSQQQPQQQQQQQPQTSRQQSSPEQGDLLARISALPAAPESPLLSKPLQPGYPAPDFILPDENRVVHKLSELRGKTVILSFYPQDYSSMCTTTLVRLSATLPEFQKRDAVVFGISVQQPSLVKARFASEFKIVVPLLADTGGYVARKYHVLSESGLASRVTFIIGKDGKILFTDQHVHPTTHDADLLAALDRIGRGSTLFN